MIIPALSILLASIISVPTRSGTISITIPEGWRTLQAIEIQRLKPDVQPQTKLQERLAQEPRGDLPVLAAKHDTDGTIAASMQIYCNPIPDKMRYASSMELARVIAFAASATYRARYEVQPRETTVSGLPAAEWISRYNLVESAGGSHDMKSHTVVVAVGNNFYIIGYAGPAADAADPAAFSAALGSIKIQKNPSTKR
jgi:hypothetical protein